MGHLNRWRTVALIAAALFVGSIVGPPLVEAATTGIVTIEGAGSTHKAKVSAQGELSVNTNLTQTKAGQVEATEAGAGSTVVLFRGVSCSANGIYTVPAGKALIITGVNFYNHPSSPGSLVEMDLFAGKTTAPCTSLIAAGISTDDLAQNQVFQPGIPVPAGDSLGAQAVNNVGTVEIYGYLVAASAVPASAAAHALSGHPGQSDPTMRNNG